MKLNDGLGRFVITILFCLVVIATSAVFISTRPQPKKNITQPLATGRINYIKAGWKHYINETLGIEFQYPQQWGEARTFPTENITNLQTVNKDFLEDEDNEYRYMVEIRFSQNDDIDLYFINNDFQGSKYPNGYAYSYGPANNFVQLKNTGNICEYHLSFDHRPQYPDTLEEQYDVCENHIKTTMTKDSHFDSGYYNYKVSQFYFKKINNGFFDNLLIENYITSTADENSNLTYEDLINKNNSQNNHQQNMTLFKEFVDTIVAFNPPQPTPIVLSVKPGEDSNISTIRQYYFYLATQKLESAYAMYQNQNVSFTEFTKWYDQVFNTKIGDIKQVSLNTYKFDVDISEQNLPVSKYRVNMEVKNGKINTLSSEQITSDEVKFNNLTVYTRTKLHKNEIVLIKDGNEKVIDSCDDNYETHMDTTCSFDDPRFSPLGDYLIYTRFGWEWSSPIVYNLNKDQVINIDLSSSDIIFTKDENNLIACSSVGMNSGASAQIYSLPSFNIVQDFFKNNKELDNIFNVDCQYIPGNSTLKISLFDDKQQEKTINYDLGTSKIIP